VVSAARLMWPEPATVEVHGAGQRPVPAGDIDGHSDGGLGRSLGQSRRQGRRLEFLLVPSAANPKLVLPATPYAAAAAAAGAATAAGAARAAARTAALVLGLRSGVAARVLRDRLVVDLPEGGPAIDEHLGQIVGREVVVGFRMGPPRANRKPVLQLVTPLGALVGYAKLGVNALTDSLVTAEACALTRLGDAHLAGVQIPSLLYSGTWQGHPLVVQSALPVGRLGRAPGVGRTASAMAAVAGAEGVSRLALAELPWWQRTSATVADLPASDAAARLAGIGQHLATRSEQVVLAGSWHGDWNPGNCASGPDQVLVWDWERYESGVPVGFDALHLSLQSAIGSGVDPLAAAGRLVSDAPELLAPFGIESRARLVATLYLFGLGARYLHDDQAAAGAAVGRLETWLLPTLEEVCDGPPAGSCAHRPAVLLAEGES
jgi:hypothetical protein